DALAGWRAATAEFARCEDTAVKVSGIGVPGQAWTAALNGGVVRNLLDIFGPNRCMFGSNFLSTAFARAPPRSCRACGRSCPPMTSTNRKRPSAAPRGASIAPGRAHGD
ncbi:MAG: amidohydrolase family protein, partial [Acetobacteraceae bacterium]|nr:amidohydrolase family protein [Acetobacteraceae bacterium]